MKCSFRSLLPSSCVPFFLGITSFGIGVNFGSLWADTVSVAEAHWNEEAGVVEIYYGLQHEAYSGVTVDVRISTDGGEAFIDIPPNQLSGEVGEGQMPGDLKHIVWFPLDYELELGANPVVQFELLVTVDHAPDDQWVLVEGDNLNLSMGNTTVENFLIARHEVRWDIWQDVGLWGAENGYDLMGAGMGCDANHPVHSVSWFEVVKWCNAFSEMSGLMPVYHWAGQPYREGNAVPELLTDANGFRLPLEAEWEFAALGGRNSQGFLYSGSNELSSVGWYSGNSDNSNCSLFEGRGTNPVGQKAGNELGLFDMSGNVWEWCWDQAEGPYRQLRGGSWYDADVFNVVSARYDDHPQNRYEFTGFRLARNEDGPRYYSTFTNSVILSASLPDDSEFWEDAEEWSNGWLYTPWFGVFKDNVAPQGWIFHLRHGWLLFSGESTESFYFYDPALEEWFWSSRHIYPWVHRFKPDKEWDRREWFDQP